MKINTREPRVCTTRDSAFSTIELLQNQPKNELAVVLKALISLKFNTATCLSDWIDVLNTFDDILKAFISKYKHLLFVDSNQECDASASMIDECDLSEISHILSFTANLLRQSYGKEVYSSVEHLVELLGCFNFQIATFALECLHALGVPPASHRCEQYLERHFTSLHKNAAYFATLFDIVEAAYNPSRIYEYLVDSFVPPHDYCVARVDPSTFVCNRKDSSTLKVLLDNHESWTLDITHDTRDIGSIMRSLPPKLSVEQRYSLLWQVTIKRMISTLDGRKTIVTVLYQAISILLYCHPDSSLLFKYFLNKSDLIKDFIYFLEFGPGTAAYNPEFANPQIRSLACSCLSALLENHDHSSGSMVSQNPWIVNDLGVGRGQFMGLLPQLLRSSSSYLINLKKFDQSSQDMQYRLEWIEHVFSIISAIVNVPNALASLLDNGLVSSLLSIISCVFDGLRLSEVVHIEALSLEILDSSFSQSSQMAISFRDGGGLNIIVNRLSFEVTRLIENRSQSLAPSDNILIQVLIAVISSFMQEGRENSEGVHLLLFRNAVFTESLRLIFVNADFFSATIISSCINLLVDVINKDAAPPTVLNGMIASRVPQEALVVLRKVQSPFLFEVPLNILSLISCLSITAECQSIVVESLVFKDIFKMYHNEQYFFPVSKTMNLEVASNIGANLEEIIRHHPQFLGTCLTELFLALFEIAGLGEQCLQNSMKGNALNSCDLSDKYVMVFNFAEAITATLEPLLMKKQTVEYFFAHKGFDLLVRLLSISLGPPKFLLTSLASITYAAQNSVGYSCLQDAISRCLHQIVEIDAPSLLGVVIDHMYETMTKYEEKVMQYWQYDVVKTRGIEFNSQHPLSNILETISSTPIPDIESIEEKFLTVQFSSLLRPMLLLTRLFHSFGDCFSSKIDKEAQDKCLDIASQKLPPEALRKIVENLYVMVVKEMARAKSVVVSPNMIETSYVQPFYHLMITGDSVSVKENLEDGGKKVTRLSKGTRIVAYERAYTVNNSLKYRVNEGWISVFKSSSVEGPQCIVYDITKKTGDEMENELRRNEVSLQENNQKRYVFASLSNLSARRAGVMTLFYLHTFLKESVMAPLNRYTLIRPTPSHQSLGTIKLHRSAVALYPLWSSSVLSLLPSEFAMKMPPDVLFAKLSIPSLDSFGVYEVYCTSCGLELCYSLLFNTKSRSRNQLELNSYFLGYLMNNNDIFEKLLANSANIFLCALNPFILGEDFILGKDLESILIELGVDVSNGWYKVRDETVCFAADITEEYNKFRLKYRERTINAISSLESMLDFWKQFLTVIFISHSTNHEQLFNSLFEGCSSEASELSAEALKRKLLFMIIYYFQPLLSHILLPTLPPKLSRLCVELLGLMIKAHSALQDSISKRSQPISSNVGRLGLPFLTSSSGMLFGSLPPPGLRSRAPMPVFSPDQTVVQNLIEMGFERSGILAAMRSIHSNDPNALVPFLLDNPYLSSIPVEEDEGNQGVNDDETIGTENPPIPILPTITDNESPSITEDFWKRDLLNLEPIISSTNDELKLNGKRQIESMFRMSFDILFGLLEKGVLNYYGLLDPEIANSLASFSKEAFTIMLLNHSFKLFEHFNLSEGSVRLVELTFLWKRLEKHLVEMHRLSEIAMKNLLTALLMLTVGKISNFGRVSASPIDIVSLFLKVDTFVGSVCTTLMATMCMYLQNCSPELSSFEWCIPGLLLVDALIQPMSVDSKEVYNAVKELDILSGQSAPTELRMLIGNTDILSRETKMLLLGLGDFEKDGSIALPLFSFKLSSAAVMNVIHASHLVLSLATRLPEDQRTVAERASIQMLIHLQSQYDCRDKLLEMNICNGLLRTKSKFDGQTRMIVTIVQRLLEDENSLKQSFKSSMKVVYDRMSKKSNPEVSLKSFIELCCPLLYRSQVLFLESLEERFIVKNKQGQLVLIPNAAAAPPPPQISTPQMHASAQKDDETAVITSKKMRNHESFALGTKFDSSDFSVTRKLNQTGGKSGKSIRQQVAQSIIEDIFKQITISSFLTEQREKLSALTVPQLLNIIADLIVSNQTFLSLMLRQRISVSATSNTVSVLEYIIRYLICSEPSFFPEEIHKEVVDASRYLFAAIFSRSGETRYETGQVILNVLYEYSSDNEHHPKVVAVVETILSLLLPSPKWTERDSFVIPTQEIIKWFVENKLLNILMTIFSHLKPNEVQDRLTMRPLAIAIDILMKKSVNSTGQSLLPKNILENSNLAENRLVVTDSVVGITDDHICTGQLVEEAYVPTDNLPQEDDWQEEIIGSESPDGNESELEPSPNNGADDDDDDDDDDDVIELEEIDDEDPVYMNHRGDNGDDSSESDRDHSHHNDSDSENADNDMMSVEDHGDEDDDQSDNHLEDNDHEMDEDENESGGNDEEDVDEFSENENANSHNDFVIMDNDNSDEESGHEEPDDNQEDNDDDEEAANNHEERNADSSSRVSSHQDSAGNDVVDDENTIANGTDEYENDVIMAPPSPQSIVFDEIERGDMIGLGNPRRHPRELSHRNRFPTSAANDNHLLPPGLLQLLSGSDVDGRGNVEDRTHRRSHHSNLRRVLGGEHVSIEDIVANVFQSGEVTSSSARVDPRTGSITLNISRRIGGSNGNPSNNMLYHPFLNIANEIRRTERSSSFSQLISGARSAALNVLGIHSNREQPYLIFEPSKSASTRASNLLKRREIGPLLSDRRWGLDIGEIEACGSNLPFVASSVEAIMKNRLKLMECEQPNFTTKSIPLHGPPLNDFFQNFVGSLTQHRHLFEDVAVLPEEMKEEPAVLQETKEPDPSETYSSVPSGAAVEPMMVSHSAAPREGSTVNAVENSNLLQENVDFINTLPPELRQEVLVAAEAEFLESLTFELQAEARMLRGEAPINNAAQSPAAPPFSTSSLSVAEPTTSDDRIPSKKSSDVKLVSSTSDLDAAWLISIAKGIDDQLPCSPTFFIRTIHWLYVSRNDHLSTVLLKLLANFCRYNNLRPLLLSFLVCILSDNLQEMTSVVDKLVKLCSEDGNLVECALREFFNTIQSTSRSLKSSIYRKLLATLSVLLRKTDYTVWFDVMSPSASLQKSEWIFASIIDILVAFSKSSSVDLDSILQLVEKLCSPYAKLTVKQINDLIPKLAQLQARVISSGDSEATLIKKVIPFPVLDRQLGGSLASIIAQVDGSSIGRKSLMRIMRYLSLFDGNWKLLLNELSLSSVELVRKAFLSFNNINNALQSGISSGEDALTIMTRPEFANSQVMWEGRLLNTLRMMTVLRARSGPASKDESVVVSQYMQNVDISALWDCLCDCLDSVREVEGIIEITPESDSETNNNIDATPAGSSNAVMKKAGQPVLSSLVTRFIPLMECCLMIYEKVALVHPTAEDNSSSTAASAPEASPRETNLLRTNSIIPGSRFRQSANYKQMQMEIIDENSAVKLGRFTEQNQTLLNIILKNNVHFLETSFSPLITVPKCRSFLHFDVKRAYFKARLKKMRQSAARQSFHGSLRIQVRRNHVFEESFQALRSKTADEMRRKMIVSFHGEEGMDAGGLTREWYSVLAREIFNANYALFISAGDNVTFQPNPHSYVNHHHLSYFKFIGRVIGKAICDGHLLDVHFTRSFYKHILGLPVTVLDLEAIEPDYYKSLIQILDTPLDLLGLDLTFSAEVNEFGQISTVDLIPNGRDIVVTDDTKHEYVKLLAHHRMTSAIRKQTDAFLEGFHELVPAELISIFDAQELELLISGLPEIDLDDLRAHTDYHGYKSTDPTISNFWSALRAFSKEEKALFLQFVTGTSKVPLDGFKALQGADGIKQFNIHKAFGEDKLPTAHTCFNQLDLPEYATEELMREKLLLAIKEGSEGFGFA